MKVHILGNTVHRNEYMGENNIQKYGPLREIACIHSIRCMYAYERIKSHATPPLSLYPASRPDHVITATGLGPFNDNKTEIMHVMDSWNCCFQQKTPLLHLNKIQQTNKTKPNLAGISILQFSPKHNSSLQQSLLLQKEQNTAFIKTEINCIF